ncbi:MAG: hypothetical protein ACK4OG_14390 [Parvibaculum sp.]
MADLINRKLTFPISVYKGLYLPLSLTPQRDAAIRGDYKAGDRTPVLSGQFGGLFLRNPEIHKPVLSDQAANDIHHATQSIRPKG